MKKLIALVSIATLALSTAAIAQTPMPTKTGKKPPMMKSHKMGKKAGKKKMAMKGHTMKGHMAMKKGGKSPMKKSK